MKCKHLSWQRIGVSDEIDSCFDCGATVREMLEDYINFRARAEAVIETLEEHNAIPEIMAFIRKEVFRDD